MLLEVEEEARATYKFLSDKNAYVAQDQDAEGALGEGELEITVLAAQDVAESARACSYILSKQVQKSGS